jgi:hypothetical protein
MAQEGWTAIKTDPPTLEGADAVAETLARTGLTLTRAQVLAAAVAKGVRDFLADPKSLIPDEAPSPKGRKRATA